MPPFSKGFCRFLIERHQPERIVYVSARVPISRKLRLAAGPPGFRVPPRAAAIGLHILVLTIALCVAGCSWAGQDGVRLTVMAGFSEPDCEKSPRDGVTAGLRNSFTNDL